MGDTASRQEHVLQHPNDH